MIMFFILLLIIAVAASVGLIIFLIYGSVKERRLKKVIEADHFFVDKYRSYYDAWRGFNETQNKLAEERERLIAVVNPLRQILSVNVWNVRITFLEKAYSALKKSKVFTLELAKALKAVHSRRQVFDKNFHIAAGLIPRIIENIKIAAEQLSEYRQLYPERPTKPFRAG